MIKNKINFDEIKVFAFDLDGVIINSLPNMEKAWLETCKKNKLNIPFFKYKKLIGLPFEKILKILQIKKNFLKIKNDYRYFSLVNINLIKCYPNIKKVLNLISKRCKIAIITSKEKKRSIHILNKNNIKYDILVTPNDVKKGKPDTESIDKVLKKFSINKKNILLVGDTIFDYKMAKKSKINFYFATWGYGAIKGKGVIRLNSPSEILNRIL